MNALDCKKCIQQEFTNKEYYKSVSVYISNIPMELKTTDDVYAYRLEQCDKCKYIINGLCRLCGCFVAIRAASVHNYCPDKKASW